nr:immunoglobulin light chain junction region [Macaca mulatta]MOV78204.1 immunoglobulin light chain junction region [Macaca mulatta]MOV78634.1 immunoglobulin light chain junction region [Macaca mulatta]MOV78815.1 immunoglobulin light chain junction region [Macaca mulatta]MOV79742.1 immunoglobulin light chain junction region [Macaca mulatta]
CLQSKNSPWSF